MGGLLLRFSSHYLTISGGKQRKVGGKIRNFEANHAFRPPPSFLADFWAFSSFMTRCRLIPQI